MASETITIWIDPVQLQLQQDNNYSLFLAKKVNDSFTVIWQSLGPVTTSTKPGYGPKNTFQIAVPNYQVNYSQDPITSGSVTSQVSGISQTIEVGQTVALDKHGLFGPAANGGTPGVIIINNDLAGDPHAVLLDDAGNPIFTNVASGMDIGAGRLTPIDTYQIWFDNLQQTGDVIAENLSNPVTVVFAGETNKVISYNADGVWEDGALKVVDLAAQVDGDPLSVVVLATFKYALTTTAVTYLLNKLIDKFSANLRPKKLEAQIGGSTLKVVFEGAQNRQIVTTFGTDKFEDVVNEALGKAKADASSGLTLETWSVGEPSLAASY